jgi:hypothetical protein
MSTQPPDPPKQPDGNPGNSDIGERLGSVEERLRSMEEKERLHDIEDRVQNLEQGYSGEGGEEGQGYAPTVEGEGQKALNLAFARLLNNEAVVQALTSLTKTVGDAVKERVGLKTKEMDVQKQLVRLGLGFSAFVLIMLSALVWKGKITQDLAAALIGSLIGYWYGHDRGK